jgi:hypothetical protein
MIRRKGLWPQGRTFAAALGLAAFAVPAHGAQVRGKIAGAEKLIPEVYSEIAKSEHRYTWREPSPTVRPDFRVLSANPSRDVCIAAISTGTAQKHDPIQITVTGGHTFPSTIVVSPQTVISFVNHDPFTHRLFQEGNEAGFKPEDMQSNGHREWTAPGPGRYEFRDKLAPTLRFYVVVDLGVVEVVYPGHNGAFAFRDLPTGDYFLKAFFDGKQVGKPLQVVATRGTVELKEPLTLEETK